MSILICKPKANVHDTIALSTWAALAAARLASAAAVVLGVLSFPPSLLPGVLEACVCGDVADEGCELLPKTRPGCAKWSASFADFEHRPPIVID